MQQARVSEVAHPEAVLQTESARPNAGAAALRSETVAIVIPCKDEADNLRLLLPQVNVVARSLGHTVTVHVVDGHSTDATRDVAAEYGAAVMTQHGNGYGGAIRTALHSIDADWIVTLDADCSHPPGTLKSLLSRIDTADIVIASRYVEHGYARMPAVRHLLSRVLSHFFRLALAVPVRDMSSGYRAYRRSAIAAIPGELDTFAFLPEILLKAYARGYRVVEVPFHYRPRASGASHARVLAFGMQYLKLLLSFWVFRNSVACADYDSRAFSSRIPLQRWWQRRRYQIISEMVGSSLSVLDVGCGSGQLLVGLPQIVGLDYQLNKLRFMRAPGRLLLRGSIFEVPVASGSFETVVCSQVIEHVPMEAALDGLERCLAPGGTLVLGTVDYGGWQWPLIERIYGFVQPGGYADEHITHYTREMLVEALTKRHFEVLEIKYIANAEIIIKARKPGVLASPMPMVTASSLDAILRCPKDQAPLVRHAAGYICTLCTHHYPILDSIPDFVISEASDAYPGLVDGGTPDRIARAIAAARRLSATQLVVIACAALLANGMVTLLQGWFGGSPSTPYRAAVVSLGLEAVIAGVAMLSVTLGFTRWKYGRFWPPVSEPDTGVANDAATGRALLWSLIGWLTLMIIPSAVALSRNPYEGVTWVAWGLQDYRWLISGYLLTVVSAVALPPLASRFLNRNRSSADLTSASTYRLSRSRLCAAAICGAAALALFAPPWNIELLPGEVGNHDVHLSQLQAIHTGAVPYIGPASIQYGPGSQLLQYAYMTLTDTFSLLGYRETYALSTMLAFGIFTTTIVAVLGLRVGLLASLLALYISPFALFQWSGPIFTGFFGWGNSFRYLGTLSVLALMPLMMPRGRGWWNRQALVMGLGWGFFTYMSQENLATTILASGCFLLASWGLRTYTFEQIRRTAFCLLAGLVLFWIPILAYYLAVGELSRFVESYSLVPRFVAAGMSNTPWDPVLSRLWTAAFYATPAVLLVAAWLAIFDWNKPAFARPLSYERQTLLALACASLVCFTGAMLRKDSSHFVNALIGLPAVIAALAVQMGTGKGRVWLRMLVIASLAGFFWQFPPAPEVLHFPQRYVLAPWTRFHPVFHQDAWRGDAGIAFRRAGAFTDSRYAIYERAAPARAFLEEMNAMHALVGGRPTFVHSFPHVPPEIVYFFADLKPGPILFNVSTMVFHTGIQARFLQDMNSRCAEFRALVGTDRSVEEAAIFRRCHSDIDEISREIAGERYFIWITRRP